MIRASINLHSLGALIKHPLNPVPLEKAHCFSTATLARIDFARDNLYRRPVYTHEKPQKNKEIG